MIQNIVNNKSTKLFIVLGCFFIANALIAEVIGVKIFSLEHTLGLQDMQIRFFGETLQLNLTAGVLLWPVVFIMTDIINEYYGMKGVRMLSYIAAALITYAFIMFYGSINLAPATFFVASKQGSGVPNMQLAYSAVLGQGGKIIIGSLTAFIIGQLVDVVAFHKIKKITGEKKIWLRATGSTLISQCIDSYVVLFVAFYVGSRIGNNPGDFVWSFKLFLAVGTVNYLYKSMVAIVFTPVIYILHYWIENYLGHESASEMKQAAITN